jgi:hypothetical protein
MARLINERTGGILAVDLGAAGLMLGALLPSSAVEEGLPVTDSRTVLPALADVEVLLAAIPGVGDDPIVVESDLDEWARRADRLSLVVEGLPTISGLMIGSRSLSVSARNTSTRIGVQLQEVRIVRSAVGEIDFPPAAPALRSGRAPAKDAGDVAPGAPKRRSSILATLSGVGQ